MKKSFKGYLQFMRQTAAEGFFRRKENSSNREAILRRREIFPQETFPGRVAFGKGGTFLSGAKRSAVRKRSESWLEMEKTSQQLRLLRENMEEMDRKIEDFKQIASKWKNSSQRFNFGNKKIGATVSSSATARQAAGEPGGKL